MKFSPDVIFNKRKTFCNFMKHNLNDVCNVANVKLLELQCFFMQCLIYTLQYVGKSVTHNLLIIQSYIGTISNIAYVRYGYILGIYRHFLLDIRKLFYWLFYTIFIWSYAYRKPKNLSKLQLATDRIETFRNCIFQNFMWAFIYAYFLHVFTVVALIERNT